MCPGNPLYKANGNNAQAVGSIKSMFAGFPGQEVNSNSAQAVGSMKTMFSGCPGQEECTGSGLYRNSIFIPSWTTS